MLRYEANINGVVEPDEPFTNFDELKELEKIFSNLGWNYEIIRKGRGGYYLFNLQINDIATKVHIYLKRITFGGRESRPYEKRVQFSAALDRAGFSAKNSELSLILGIYKREENSLPVICAWDINDWGYNAGRAFNCFIDIRSIANTFTEGQVQSRTSIGQVVYSFIPNRFYSYLKEVKDIYTFTPNKKLGTPAIIEKSCYNSNETDVIPNHTGLFQITINILKSEKYNGKAGIQAIEEEAANKIRLSENARKKIHNLKEGTRTELGYQLAWARTYLKLAGLIYSPLRSIWALTTKGWETDIVDKFDIIRSATGKNAQEEFEFNENENENEIESKEGVEYETTDGNSSEIKHPFDASKVDIRTRSMTLDLILKRLKHDGINLNTGFQRKAGLWDNGKQSRLIESILIRFPLPAFYFDGSNDNEWLVVDGLQRITALNRYVNNLEFELTGLEFLTEYLGCRFSELPIFLQRRIEEFEITAYIIAAGTPPELKYNVFKRINTGGLILSDQEIRNALNQGTPVKFIKELSMLHSFKLATDYSIPEDRMLDQEFITRFLAFYIFDYEQEYSSDLDSYLNKAMSYLSQYVWDDNKKSEELINIKKDFEKSMTATLKIFGSDAFRKRYDINSRRNPINKALFDSWSVILSKLSKEDLELLMKRKDTVLDKFIELMNTSEDFNKAISSSTGDKSRVKKRFSEILKIVQITLSQI